MLEHGVGIFRRGLLFTRPAAAYNNDESRKGDKKMKSIKSDGIEFLKTYRAHPERYYPLVSHQLKTFPCRDEFGDVNIGWNCGLLDEKRPYFMEFWATEGISMLTIFISTEGIENASVDELDKMMAAAGICRKLPNARETEARKFRDSDGNEFFSAGVVVGTDFDDAPQLTDDCAFYYPFSILNEFNGAED